MKDITIYTLTSPLHDEQSVTASTHLFLSSLGIDYDMCGSDFSTYGQSILDLIYVRTGGTENIFRQLLPQIQSSGKPVLLLTSGTSNSLAASMEILSFLQQNNMQGEILHGQPQYIIRRISELQQLAQARRMLQGCRLGVIGKPSDWLISSASNYRTVRNKFGIDLIDIPLNEIRKAIGNAAIDGGQQ